MEFTFEKRTLEAKVDDSGALEKVKEHLPLAAVSSAIAKALAKDYPENTVREVEKTLSPAPVLYEVELSNQDETISVILDQTGKILKQQNDDEDGDTETDND